MRGVFSAVAIFATLVSALPHPNEVDRRDIMKLFERQQSSYPPTDAIPGRSDIPQAWLDRLASINVPSIPVATGTGTPDYAGRSRTDPEICSFTYQCDSPEDLKTPPAGVMAFTFDDGPAGGTAALSAYLNQQNAKGLVTHFMIGSYISRNRDAFRDIAKDGHVASHTWSHQYMTTLTNEQVVGELGWSLQIMADLNDGRVPMYWRPPYGDVDNRVRAIAKGVFGLHTVTWSQDTGDWNLDQGRSTTVQSISDTYKTWLADRSTGLNVLHHEVRESQVDAFKAVYPALTGGWKVQNIADAFGRPWYQNALTANSSVTSMAIGAAAPSLSAAASSASASVSSAAASSVGSASSVPSASSVSSATPASSSARSSVSTAAASQTAVLSTGAGTMIRAPILAAMLVAGGTFAFL